MHRSLGGVKVFPPAAEAATKESGMAVEREMTSAERQEMDAMMSKAAPEGGRFGSGWPDQAKMVQTRADLAERYRGPGTPLPGDAPASPLSVAQQTQRELEEALSGRLANLESALEPVLRPQLTSPETDDAPKRPTSGVPVLDAYRRSDEALSAALSRLDDLLARLVV